MRHKVLVLVVAYQAESTLAGVLNRIPPLPRDVDVETLVIDDSSSDRTFEVGLRSHVLDARERAVGRGCPDARRRM